MLLSLKGLMLNNEEHNDIRDEIYNRNLSKLIKLSVDQIYNNINDDIVRNKIVDYLERGYDEPMMRCKIADILEYRKIEL